MGQDPDTTEKAAFEKLLNDPVVAKLASAQETAWFREAIAPAQEVLDRVGPGVVLVEEARIRFRRFAPWFMDHFPGSRPTDGILESPLVRVPALQSDLEARTDSRLPGRLWVKRDDALPVSGSIKARGGVHEVLQVAEHVAKDAGLFADEDDGCAMDAPAVRTLFAGHGIAVGSTGNLGLSIGIVASELGFRTTVHMSADARAWKKDLLRSRDVDVVEHQGNFSDAVEAGRRAAADDPSTHFVDDESSLALFAGYAVAAERLAGQLASLDVTVDAEHPLFVYLPCGVGGGPGGVTYGLKLRFGDHVHCVFAEPTAAPAMSLGVRTGLHSRISVQDIGLNGRTAADGLAVSRPSQIVGELIEELVDGYCTVSDARMKALVAILQSTHSWPVEPSATAGFIAPWLVSKNPEYLRSFELNEARMEAANHIVWSTGGSMVPEAEMNTYLAEGRSLISAVDWRF